MIFISKSKRILAIWVGIGFFTSVLYVQKSIVVLKVMITKLYVFSFLCIFKTAQMKVIFICILINICKINKNHIKHIYSDTLA